MSVLTFVAWVAVGIAVGSYGTLIGAGGGFVLVPILLFVYPSASPAQVTAVSLAVVFVNAASGSLGYYRLRRADYRTGIILAVATLPGAVLGALVVGAVPRRAFNLILGILLILVSLLLLVQPHGRIPLLVRSRFTVTRILVDADQNQYEYRFNLGLVALLSTLIGFLSSLLGIGGGIIHVPLLTIFFAFPAHVAAATSQFVLMIMAATGSVTHLLHHDYGSLFGVTLALAVGVLVGAQVGARLSRRIGASLIIRLLALALGGVGIRLLFAG
ncbi:MAG TPA: sulfite exporter TauE/SafE family protein [Candidatus Dormibacteraeota bacterium]